MSASVTHYGLDSAKTADIRVTFPDGTVVSQNHVPANKRIIIRDQ